MTWSSLVNGAYPGPEHAALRARLRRAGPGGAAAVLEDHPGPAATALLDKVATLGESRVAFVADAELAKRLRVRAAERGLSVGEACRQAVAAWVR